jgi:Skp family chaperone for outer membrane proteins
MDSGGQGRPPVTSKERYNVRTTLFSAASAALLIAALAFTELHAQPGGQGQSPPAGQGQAPARAAASTAPAAGAPASSAGSGGIAVVDVTYILDHYSRLKQATDAFKRDMDTAEAQLKKERDAMAKKAEKLKTFKPGTPEFKSLEEELIKGESDWKLRVNRQKGEFAERDANNFLKAYQEMTAAVKTYADRNGIALVLRFNGAPIDSTNPQAVQMELSKLVMHYQKDIDITDQILAELNRNAAVATPRTQPPPRR